MLSLFRAMRGRNTPRGRHTHRNRWVAVAHFLLIGTLYPAQISPGIEEFLRGDYPQYAGRRLGLVTSPGHLTPGQDSLLERLDQHYPLQLIINLGEVTDRSQRDPVPRLAFSRLTLDSLRLLIRGLDAVLVDLQPLGIRTDPVLEGLGILLQAAAASGVEVVVLDRPNPLGGDRINGNVFTSTGGLPPLAYRHGMTLGELARLIVGEYGYDLKLTVIPLSGWYGETWAGSDSTWFPTAAPAWPEYTITGLLAPGRALAVGRGTGRAFLMIGSPELTSGSELALLLEELEPPGVRFEPAVFVPRQGPYRDQICNGVRIQVSDLDLLDPWGVAVAVQRAVLALAPAHPLALPGEPARSWEGVLGGAHLRRILEARDEAGWEAYQREQGEEREAFEGLRQRYLIYPRRGNFGRLDYSILLLYLVTISVLGVAAGRRQQDPRSYFLGGRQMPWILVVFSVVATETSVLTFLSIPGLAYGSDFGFLQVAGGYILGRVVVARYLLPHYFREGIESTYEFIGRRWGLGHQRYVSSVFLIMRVLADGVRLFMTAIPLTLITGWSYAASIAVIGGFTLAYTLVGGIRAVIWTDSVQFFIYILGAAITLVTIGQLIPGGMAGLWSGIQAGDKLTVFQGWATSWGDLLTRPYNVLAAVAGGALLSLASHGTDHLMVQRLLSTRTLKDGQKALLGSGVMVFIQMALFLFLGAAIWVLYQGTPLKPNEVYSWFILTHLPAGLTGLLTAGILAAAMSTLSSSINSLASATLVDWIKPFRPRAGLGTARLVSVCWALVLVGSALLFRNTENPLVEVGLSIASLVYGAILGFFLLRLGAWKVSPRGLATGFTISIGSMLILWQTTPLAWTWYVLAGGLIMILVSFLATRWGSS